ncbi:MAG TPA: hypothetical protein VGU66_18775 [Candidatus Elarobacter sp.]|nr:hypothetical protein [Candidatus Elarobacter sp.]
MDGMVQDADFNAGVIVRFLHENGIDASIDESTGFAARSTASSPANP